MAKIDRMMVGESLVGDGNEVAHIDLIIGPRGSPVESAFAHALTNNKEPPRCWPWSHRTC
jgi:5,6,7,8-tetrahydromethanopterin hydro-lyase